MHDMLRESETSFASISQFPALVFSRPNLNDLPWKEMFFGQNFQYAGHPNSQTGKNGLGVKEREFEENNIPNFRFGD